ncbi:MAG: hypothetical protein AB1402_03130 [Bacillota bacterium]
MRADGDSAPVPPAVTEAGDLELALQTDGVPKGQDWREALWKRKQKLIGVSLRPSKMPAAGESGRVSSTCESEAAGPEALTVSEVINILQELRRDAECCAELLAESSLTSNVAATLRQYADECESRLRQIESAKVVLPAELKGRGT